MNYSKIKQYREEEEVRTILQTQLTVINLLKNGENSLYDYLDFDASVTSGHVWILPVWLGKWFDA